MKVIATFEENKAVRVERINEQGLIVGERRISSIDFIKSLLQEVPLGTLLEQIAESNLKGYFKFYELDTSPEAFAEFLKKLLAQVPEDWLRDSEDANKLGEIAALRLRKFNMNGVDGTQFFNEWLKNVESIPFNENLNNALSLLFNKARKSYDNRYLPLFHEIIKSLRIQTNDNVEELQKDIKKVLPALPVQFLKEIYEERVKEHGKNAINGFSVVPKGCVFIANGTNYNSYVFEIPKTQLRVKYQSVAYENVGHPRLLCVIGVKNNKIVKMKMFAINEKEPITTNTPLYRYPFAHVYDSGDVCWRGYEEVSFENMHMLPHLFLSSTNSNHLQGNVREIYESLVGKDFNDEKLIPKNMTLMSAL